MNTLLASLALAASVGVLAILPGRPRFMQHRAVTIVSRDGTSLSGTLSLPRWRRHAVPAVVLVHGSGPLTREHLRGDTRRLVREGFAVLAYDKRGVGRSGGVFPTQWGAAADSVLTVLADDAAAAFEALRREAGIDTSRVGLFGASQASWIIPLAALRTSVPPRFHVILSGAAVSTGVEAVYSRLTGDGIRPPQSTDTAAIREAVAAYRGPTDFDPLPLWRRLRVPTLWLLGDRDLSVPTFATIARLDTLAAEGTAGHHVIRYPRAGHDLRDVATRASAPIWEDLRRWLERSASRRPDHRPASAR